MKAERHILPFALALFCLCSLLPAPAHAFWGRQQEAVYQPDWYMITTTAGYRPVNVPGTQRRVAQTDAEEKARHLIYEHVGSMPMPGGGTVNDAVSKNPVLKARLLQHIRNAEVVDWQVNVRCACVQVWVRVDLHHVRAILSACANPGNQPTFAPITTHYQ